MKCPRCKSDVACLIKYPMFIQWDLKLPFENLCFTCDAKFRQEPRTKMYLEKMGIEKLQRYEEWEKRFGEVSTY